MTFFPRYSDDVTCYEYHPLPYATPTLLMDASSLNGMIAHRGAPSSCTTCYMHHATCYSHSANGCLVSRRDDGSSGCTAVEPCNMLHAPQYMLCPLCRWMPCISGCCLAGATSVFLSRGNATCFTHSASGCPVSWRDDGSLRCTVEPCNTLYAPRTMHHATPILQVDAPDFGMTACFYSAVLYY